MNKQVLALAIAGVLVTQAAAADTVNVNVYGRIRAGVEVVNGPGAPAGNNSKRQVRIVDNYSVLGFKGTEDLGNDLIGLWQAEGQLEADGDADGRLAARNTFVGLKGGFGTVLLGRIDTPYKQIKKYIAVAPVDDSTAEISAIFGKFNHGGTSAQNFYTRQNSTIQYITPDLKGFEFKIGFAPDEAKKSSTNRARVSTSLSYDTDAFFVLGAYENRADTVGNDSAEALGINGGVKFGKAGHVALGAERISAGDRDQTNLFLATAYRFSDNFTVGGHLARADDADGFKDSAATMVALGVQYDFSKRTSASLYGAMIKNDKNAKYNFGDNALDQLSAGGDPKVIGLGVSHKF